MKTNHPSLAAAAIAAAAFSTTAFAADRMPEVTSTSGLAEEQPVDESGRPEWTSHRRFSTTRVYIQKAPWEMGVEQWWRVRDKRDGTVEHKFQEEIEIGLPYRMQADIYFDWFADGDGRAFFNDVAFELRYAFADWGKIPLNPTLYAEYKVVDEDRGPDVYELKLLLGQQFAPRLHWGLNVVYEQEIGGERATEWQVSQGLSYTVIDGKLGVGVEMKYVHETVAGARGEPEQKFLIGPSVQWRPTKNTHIDLTALWGTNRDAQNFEGFVVFGYDFDFGPRGSAKADGKTAHAPARPNDWRYSPTSVRSN